MKNKSEKIEGTKKKEQERTKIKKKKFLKAFAQMNTRQYLAAKAVNVAPSTIWEWRQNDEEFKAAYEAIIGAYDDHIEDKLEEAIEAGDTTAIIFKCKTKLKYRGYTERQEITGKNGEAINVIVRESAAKGLDELTK